MSPASTSTSFERQSTAEPSVVVKNVNGKRLVSRTNPEISYAYGAPASGKATTRTRRSTQERGSVEAKDVSEGDALDDNADASTSSAPDAKARYQALKKRKVEQAEQQQQQLQSPSTRRSPKKMQEPSLATSMARKQSQASQEGRKSVKNTAASMSDDLSSNARRQRVSSPGRSRGFVHGHLNSFYMDRDGDTEEDISVAGGGAGEVPSSILLGAQRQGRDFLHDPRPTDLDSIHSSDLHDSRARDYSQLQREADLLANEDSKIRAFKPNGIDTPTRAPARNAVHAVDAALAALNGIAEESDGEHSATEGRKHTQRSDVQEQPSTKKQFRSPPKVVPGMTPVPIRRHVAPQPFSWLASLALLGGLLAVAYSIYRGLLLEPIVSVFPSDATLGDAALKKRVQLLESRIIAAEKQVSVFEGQIGSAKRVADQVAESARALPAELEALRTETKKGANVKLDAKMLDELKKTFAQKGENIVSSRLDVKALDAIRKDSEESLRKLSAELLAQERQHGNVIGHSALAEHVQQELTALKAALEARFNANTQEMQNEILAKVRQQQDMFERAGSWKTADDSKRKAIDSLGDAHKSLQALIDDALDVYSADRTGERDFALFTAGGRIMPFLTSPTYVRERKRPSFYLLKRPMQILLRKIPMIDRLGKSQMFGQPPAITLVPDNMPGMCWAFPGSQGTLGISLSRRVVVSKVTYEHVPASISHSPGGSSSPRDVIVWGLVERPSDLKRLYAYRAAQMSADEQDAAPAPAPPSDKYLMLASFTYDALASRAVQTFDITREAADLGIAVNVVQWQVLSNYGKEEYTCLYRVRVHGREWTLDEEEKKA